MNAAHCVGHGACKTSCPNDAIELVFGTATRGVQLPELGADYQTNVPGLYIAGEILDLDGFIGGYNFQAAFSTGWLAGDSV